MFTGRDRLALPNKETAAHAVKSKLASIHLHGAFTYRGEAFQHILTYDTHKVAYKKILFGFWVRDPLKDKKYYSEAMIRRYLPEGSTLEIIEEHPVIKPYRGCHSWNETAAESAVISIPKSHSWKLFYENYAKKAYPFRDYLLNERQDILQKIANTLPADIPILQISNSGVHVYGSSEEEFRFSCFFSHFGMAELVGTTQILGFGLALEKALWGTEDRLLKKASYDSINFIKTNHNFKVHKIEQW